jgi:hypothetical protein
MKNNNFRAWSESWQRMEYSRDCERLSLFFYQIENMLGEFKMMQSVGVYDVDRNEAFEYDIIDFDETKIGGIKSRGLIVYETDLTLVDAPCYCIEIEGRILKYFPFGFKIIGNKFENPELLKEDYGSAHQD